MKILVIDDDQLQLDMLSGFLRKQGYEVRSAANGQEAMDLFGRSSFHLVILDHRMPDMNGDEVLARMKEINPFVRAIMITAYGEVKTAVRVMKLGAAEFLEKPVNLTELLEKVQHLEDEVQIEEDIDDVQAIVEDQQLPLRLIGETSSMKELVSLIHRVAPTPWGVLIRGETGTGKELVARLVHLLSPRREGPFVEVNCAAVPENLFESELFGHEKGAFTGAHEQRKGRFESAEGGTLLLDEVGELPYPLQAKLLRALQENRITRVGGVGDIATDVRLVAVTNRDLKAMVAKGTFREDLYFRLNVFEIAVPPLRQRKEDIPALVDFFLEKYDARGIGFSEEAMARLVSYPFPGNVRELEHLVQRLATLSRGKIIQLRDLPAEIREAAGTLPAGNAVDDENNLPGKLEEMEKEMILAALERNNWVQTRAAESLGISERVLRYKMNKAGIRK